ncbi:hypothetical protein D5281_13860 [bacterium 1xD42-62]|uniref:Uncharacterized protein n=1 Tax=Parablautia muri TaxID=2320879 RepID=A0A9X5BH06_9FIRM|nr:hypothetical protein [Parablautia muri]
MVIPGGTGIIAKPTFVMISTVGNTVMGMPSGNSTIPTYAKSGTGTITKTGFMVISAISYTAVGVPSGNGAIGITAQCSAGTIAYPIFMRISTVCYATMCMSSCCSAVFNCAYLTGDRLFLSALFVVMSAVSRYRQCHN